MWVKTTVAAESLGISQDTLYKHREHMEMGKHFILISHATSYRPTYRWNLERCHEWFMKSPGERSDRRKKYQRKSS